MIRLDKITFSPEKAVCLSSQLKSIIENLSKLIGPHVLFCADIDAFSPMPKKLGFDSFELKKMGNDSSLINLCENIDQFLSGVFIAVREKNPSQQCLELLIDTEDDQFRSLDLDGVIIEIRAFDTSYFEIYSEDPVLMKNLSEIYEVEIKETNS